MPLRMKMKKYVAVLDDGLPVLMIASCLITLFIHA